MSTDVFDFEVSGGDVEVSATVNDQFVADVEVLTGTTTWVGITDKPAVIAAGANQAAARTAIGAGTSSAVFTDNGDSTWTVTV